MLLQGIAVAYGVERSNGWMCVRGVRTVGMDRTKLVGEVSVYGVKYFHLLETNTGRCWKRHPLYNRLLSVQYFPKTFIHISMVDDVV